MYWCNLKYPSTEQTSADITTHYQVWHLYKWPAVRVKKSSPPKSFCNIFTQAKYISVKFCQFIASIYPHMHIVINEIKLLKFEGSYF